MESLFGKLNGKDLNTCSQGRCFESGDYFVYDSNSSKETDDECEEGNDLRLYLRTEHQSIDCHNGEKVRHIEKYVFTVETISSLLLFIIERYFIKYNYSTFRLHCCPVYRWMIR